MIGTTLSHFKITARLGAGGMEEPMRAASVPCGRFATYLAGSSRR